MVAGVVHAYGLGWAVPVRRRDSRFEWTQGVPCSARWLVKIRISSPCSQGSVAFAGQNVGSRPSFKAQAGGCWRPPILLETWPSILCSQGDAHLSQMAGFFKESRRACWLHVNMFNDMFELVGILLYVLAALVCLQHIPHGSPQHCDGIVCFPFWNISGSLAFCFLLRKPVVLKRAHLSHAIGQGARLKPTGCHWVDQPRWWWSCDSIRAGLLLYLLKRSLCN